jgi:SAM-dependent methyltransferase
MNELQYLGSYWRTREEEIMQFLQILKGMKKKIRPHIPRKAIPIAVSMNSTFMRILCWYIGLWDTWYIKRTEFARLPPASLRYRVHGAPDIDGFLSAGKKCSQDIETALMKINKNLSSFKHILDFGCGCGRTLIWFANHSKSSRFYGTDIDAEAISWCRNNLDFANFSINQSLPPLPYPSEMFDLIYAISVFTHLNEEYQFHWLSELKRIAKPEAIVLLTVHGRHCWMNLPREDVAKIERTGFVFITTNAMKDIFPEWYQVAYHTKEYVFDRYAKYFDIVDYIPRGLHDHQDAIILQKV